jgi:hypothetical protein
LNLLPTIVATHGSAEMRALACNTTALTVYIYMKILDQALAIQNHL